MYLSFYIQVHLFCSYVATPVGRMYKLRETPPTKPVPNETLEKAFKKFHKVLPRDYSKVVVSIFTFDIANCTWYKHVTWL